MILNNCTGNIISSSELHSETLNSNIITTNILNVSEIINEKINNNNIQSKNIYSENISFGTGTGHTLDISNKITCSSLKKTRRDMIRTKSTKSANNSYTICFQNEKINNLDDYIEYTHDPNTGDTIKILVNGVYSINANFQNTTFSSTSWIDKNNPSVNDMNSASDGNLLTWNSRANGQDTGIHWTGYLEKEDTVRIKSTVPTNVSTSSNGSLFITLLYEC